MQGVFNLDDEDENEHDITSEKFKKKTQKVYKVSKSNKIKKGKKKK